MKKFMGVVVAILALGLFLQSGWPIPEAVSPVEGWIMRHGFGELSTVIIEYLVIVGLVGASFLLLRRR